VRVQGQVLAPDVQDGEEADACAQVSGVGGDVQQRLRRRVEQHVVDDAPVGQRQRVEGVGKREDDVEVLDGKQFRGAIGHPAGAGGALAPGAVPVAAGVVGDALMMAVVAGLDVAAQRGGAAGGDGAQDASLLAAQVFAEPMAVPPDDLRQFQRGAPGRWLHGVGGCSRA
jgi:hypothetical protein